MQKHEPHKADKSLGPGWDDTVREALRAHPHLGTAHAGVTLQACRDVVVVRGELPCVATRRRAAFAVRSALPRTVQLVDIMTVCPIIQMRDSELHEAVHEQLIRDPALSGCAIAAWPQPGTEERGDSPRIALRVRDGVVSLTGWVPSLVFKGIAELRAWWALGTRDVRNELQTRPDDAFGRDAAVDVVLAYAFERESVLYGSSVAAYTSDGCVTLTGNALDNTACAVAETDAWLLSQVHQVDCQVSADPSPWPQRARSRVARAQLVQ